MINLPVIDLHCDLLAYLAVDPLRTPHDPAPRCSIPQLQKGNVKLQVLAVFTETHPYSVEKGMEQLKLFQTLPLHYPKDVVHYSSAFQMESQHIALMAAYENASGFCSEQEPLEEGFKRLRKIAQGIAKPLYVSLTWNSKNRFGGGAFANSGLEEDGKRLLDLLSELDIAVDLSHASDYLAYDILDYIEGKGMNIPVMASHSNARAVHEAARNLTDEIAREVFKRGGVIGMNFFRKFVGETEEGFLNHLSHWLELGGENHVVLGSDFFYEGDFPSIIPIPGKGLYFDSFQDASCCGRFLDFVQKSIGLSPSLMEKLSHQNALRFLDPFDRQ